MSTNPTTPTTNPQIRPGSRWKPTYGGPACMSRIVVRLAPAGVVYREGWPSDGMENFARWATWADWLLETGAVRTESTT